MRTNLHLKLEHARKQTKLRVATTGPTGDELLQLIQLLSGCIATYEPGSSFKHIDDGMQSAVDVVRRALAMQAHVLLACYFGGEGAYEA